MTLRLELEQYEKGKILNHDPLVCIFEDFVSDEEIEHILVAAKPKLRQALVSAAKSGVESDLRTGQICWVPHGEDQVIQCLARRIAEIVGLHLGHAENFQVIHYEKCQQYAPHFDGWDASMERGQRCMAKKGQRLVTCLLYLNEPTKGGGTSFPNLNLVVQAKKGRMVVFHNCQEGTIIRHKKSLHAGMPVEAGEKWACNLWFREKPYRNSTTMSTSQSDNKQMTTKLEGTSSNWMFTQKT